MIHRLRLLASSTGLGPVERRASRTSPVRPTRTICASIATARLTSQVQRTAHDDAPEQPQGVCFDRDVPDVQVSARLAVIHPEHWPLAGGSAVALMLRALEALDVDLWPKPFIHSATDEPVHRASRPLCFY